jgi:hypothetical protein
MERPFVHAKPPELKNRMNPRFYYISFMFFASWRDTFLNCNHFALIHRIPASIASFIASISTARALFFLKKNLDAGTP